jgi:hypothetical protein
VDTPIIRLPGEAEDDLRQQAGGHNQQADTNQADTIQADTIQAARIQADTIQADRRNDRVVAENRFPRLARIATSLTGAKAAPRRVQNNEGLCQIFSQHRQCRLALRCWS